ncbi:MAG: V-type ATP synthase subunit E [Ruminococcus sp.]|nr:V-type ATP synthase subunit E [Ruminococcus sp.]
MTDEAVKLRRFRDAVTADAREQAEEMLSKAKAESEEIRQKARADAQRERAHLEEQINERAEAILSKDISQARLASQRKVLLKREELADGVFDTVREKIAAFRKSGEYKDWLIDTVSACVRKYPSANSEVHASPEDAPLIFAEPDETIRLGGVCVYFKEMGIVLDCTLDTRLEHERKSFSKLGELL